MRRVKEALRSVLPAWTLPVRRYRWAHKRLPNLIHPQTFSEKVVWRICFDRRPILACFDDKAAVRDYVASRVGDSILTKLYWQTTSPETIPFDDLPERFVVKPTHGSGWVRLVTGDYDREALIAECRGWLSQNFYDITGEWSTRDIEPQILVEEFIDDGSSLAPNDYKIFVFDGVVKLIQVDAGRFIEHRRSLFDRSWRKIDALYAYDGIEGEVCPPLHLEEMICTAEKLGEGIDFVRVDLYDTPDKVYFGELTTTPEAGLGVFRPKEFDRYLGSLWNQRRR